MVRGAILTLFAVFTVASGQDCKAPNGITNILSSACKIGDTIPDGQSCVGQCTSPQVADVTPVCTKGVLTPPTFKCIDPPGSCKSPNDISNMFSHACKQGDLILNGETCTTQCTTGWSPDIDSLKCNAGTLEPATFKCKHVLSDSSSGNSATSGGSSGKSSESSADSWNSGNSSSPGSSSGDWPWLLLLVLCCLCCLLAGLAAAMLSKKKKAKKTRAIVRPVQQPIQQPMVQQTYQTYQAPVAQPVYATAPAYQAPVQTYSQQMPMAQTSFSTVPATTSFATPVSTGYQQASYAAQPSYGYGAQTAYTQPYTAQSAYAQPAYGSSFSMPQQGYARGY